MRSNRRRNIILALIVIVVIGWIAIAAFIFTRGDSTNDPDQASTPMSTLAEGVLQYEFLGDRGEIVYATETGLHLLDVQSGDDQQIFVFDDLQLIGPLHRQENGSVYVTASDDPEYSVSREDPPNVFIEISASAHIGRFDIVNQPAAGSASFTERQASIAQKKTGFCDAILPDAVQVRHLEGTQYAIAENPDGEIVAARWYECESVPDTVSSIVADRNPNFEKSADEDNLLYFANDTTIADTELNITIDSAIDPEEAFDCSSFFGAPCPVTHVIAYADARLILDQEETHIGNRLPRSLYFTAKDASLVLLKSNEELLRIPPVQ